MPLPRFTLRAMLILVAVCAVVLFAYSLLPNLYVTQWELDQLRPGMSSEQVRSILGEPYKINRSQAGEVWFYGKRYVVVEIDSQGRFVAWDYW